MSSPFDRWPDESTMLPNEVIRSAEIEAYRGNQLKALENDSVYMAEMHCELEFDSATTYEPSAGTFYRKINLRGIDLCGTASTTDGGVLVLAYCDGTATGDLQITNATTSQDVTFTAFTNTSPEWKIGSVPSGFWSSAGSNNELELYAWRSAGTGSIYVAGVMIYLRA